MAKSLLRTNALTSGAFLSKVIIWQILWLLENGVE